MMEITEFPRIHQIQTEAREFHIERFSQQNCKLLHPNLELVGH